MSIEAAAKELTKEIECLTKEAERLTRLRDAVLVGSTTVNSQTTPPAATKVAAKKVGAKKAVAKKAAAPKKRVISDAGRKAIAEAARRRWAAKKQADAAK